MDDISDNRIGRYDIQAKIGQGGFGAVYRGRDPEIDRLVAIKVVHESALENPTLVERFRREAKAAGGLNHPSIITIYELGDHEGRPYIAMELLGGADLAHLIAKRPIFSTEQRVDLIASIADGLEYAHRRGIVHRDIKPANIRVIDDFAIKIMDFGIAKIVDSDMTRTGQVMGTVHYMAPECLKRNTVIDGRTDQYALAVTAYELMSYRRPVPGDDVSSVLYGIAHEPPDPLIELRDTKFSWLEEVIMRALAKDPADRFESCKAFADALRRKSVGQQSTMDGSVTTMSLSVDPTKPGEMTAEEFITSMETSNFLPDASAHGEEPLATRELQSGEDLLDTVHVASAKVASKPPRGSRGLQIGVAAAVGAAVVAGIFTLTRPEPAAGVAHPPVSSTPAQVAASAPPAAPTPNLPVVVPGDDESEVVDAQPPATPVPTLATPAPVAATPTPAPTVSQRELDVDRAIRRARSLERKADLPGALVAWKSVVTLDPRAPGARASITKLEERIRTASITESETKLESLLRQQHLDLTALTQERDRLRGLDPTHPLIATVDRAKSDAERLAKRREETAAVKAVLATPTPAPPNERGLIETTLETYARALDDEDLAAFKRIWPTMPEKTRKRIEQSFGFTKSHVVSLDIVKFEATGSTASAVCARHDRIETNDGQVIERDSKATFLFVKSGSSWAITDIKTK